MYAFCTPISPTTPFIFSLPLPHLVCGMYISSHVAFHSPLQREWQEMPEDERMHRDVFGKK